MKLRGPIHRLRSLRPRPLGLRTRLTLSAAASVAGAIALSGAALLFVELQDLRNRVDADLRQRADEAASELYGRRGDERPLRPPPFGAPGGYVQLVLSNGGVARLGTESPFLPVSQEARAVAAGGGDALFEDMTIEGEHVRVLTTAFGDGRAIQVARTVGEIDSHLVATAVLLGLMMLGGIALAVALGRAVAAGALRPVERLTAAAEEVARTGDPGRRIEVRGDDELSRLARSFNTMLEALEESLTAQRQLSADASHELRTPLTSIRTNFEVLARAEGIPAGERRRLIAETTDELRGLTELVEDLLELARAEADASGREPIRLDWLVEQSIEQERRRVNGGARFESRLEPWTVEAEPEAVGRAVHNLLENAVKWSPAGRPVEVTLRAGELRVRDHGPGIDPAHISRIFDRFWRAPEAHDVPGSGLGLAIVRTVAERHGWEVGAENARDGGAVLRMDTVRRDS